MMKKLMAAVLALFFAVLSAAAETEFFTDVAKNKWYYSEIKAANEAGLMVGKSATVFDPDGRVTRAEFAAILSRIDGADLSAVPAASFSDVKHGAWYEKYVSWAASAGIIKGYKDGTVRPNSGITRQELAVMIARYADSRGLALPVSPGTDSFTDGDSIAGWAKNGAEALRLAGIFVGDKAGRFLPLSNATRAEVAALSNRLLRAVNTAESTVVIAARGKRSAYTVIYPPDRAVYAADIVDLFPERLGRPVPNGTDSADPSRFEILYGETNRPESAEVMDGLAEYDYRIKVFFSDEKVTVAIGYHHYYAGASAAKALFDGYCNGYELRVPKDLDFAGTHEFDLPRGEAPEIQSDVVPLRDPFVLAEDGSYYMYGTGWRMYKNDSGSLDGHWDGPYYPVETPPDFSSDKWAPEVYPYNGQYYMFTTYRSKSGGNHGVAVFTSESPEGPFRIASDGHVTPREWDSIDGTLYIDPQGDPWMVFTHDRTDIEHDVASVAAARLSDDLTKFVSEPVTLFGARDAGWARGAIADGPFLYTCEDGELLMIWSNDNEYGYSVGVARAADGRVDGEWTHDEELLYSLDLVGMKDGGHGMIFRGFDGQTYLSFHSPNDWGGSSSRPCFLRIREENGNLVWDN